MKPKRTLTLEFKFQIVIETLRGEKSQTEIAREYDVHPQLLTNWKGNCFQKDQRSLPQRKKKNKRLKSWGTGENHWTTNHWDSIFKKNLRTAGLTSKERIQLIRQIRTNESVRLCLRTLEVPSSSYYSYSQEKEKIYQKKYQGLRKKVKKIIRRHPKYGYRRIKAELSKQGIVINHKPLKKLLKLWNLQRIKRVKSPKPSPSLAQHIKALEAKSNLVRRLTEIEIFQVIFTDFTEISCQFGALYLILFSDKVSRRIIGWNAELQENTSNALKGYRKARHYLKKMKVDLNTTIFHQDRIQSLPVMSMLAPSWMTGLLSVWLKKDSKIIQL